MQRTRAEEFSHTGRLFSGKKKIIVTKKIMKKEKVLIAIMVKYLFGHPKKEPFLLSEAVSILRFHCMIGKNVRLSKNVYNEAFQNI